MLFPMPKFAEFSANIFEPTQRFQIYHLNIYFTCSFRIFMEISNILLNVFHNSKTVFC